MNLVMVSVLLLAMLAFQPTLIYCANNNKNKYNNKYGHKNGYGKKYSGLVDDKAAAAAKLVMSLDSGDVLVRAARSAMDIASTSATGAGAAADVVNSPDTASNVGDNNGFGKRNKHTNNNNRKLNKNPTGENGSNGGRKNLDRKFSATVSQQQQQHQGNNNNNNNKGKQRQLLKSQQHHENHRKRSGNKQKNENAEKTAETVKTQSTCRYEKSAWSECDLKTNMRTRTLNLKKGEAHCLPTRTMQKKCKKACRYEKGTWSECSNGVMTREDKLKSTGNGAESNCEAMRTITKKCNPGGANKQPGSKPNKERKNKDKGSRRASQHT